MHFLRSKSTLDTLKSDLNVYLEGNRRRVPLTLSWAQWYTVTFTDKETYMHACSYSDQSISKKTKETKIFI